MENITQKIANFIKCKEQDITNVTSINKGLTNLSYSFIFNNTKYVFRCPKDYYNFLVNRKNEFDGQKLASEQGFDTSFIKLNKKSGYKLSYFIENSHNHSYTNKNEIPNIIKFFHNLHNAKNKPTAFFDPFIKSERIIKELEKNNVWEKSHNELRKKIEKLYESTKNDKIEPVFSHCDALADNIMINNDNGNIIMIDWEYSALADPGIDLGCYISDGNLNIEDGLNIIKEYLGKDYDELKNHYIIYTDLISWFWACDVNYRLFKWPLELRDDKDFISLLDYDKMLYSVADRFSFLYI